MTRIPSRNTPAVRGDMLKRHFKRMIRRTNHISSTDVLRTAGGIVGFTGFFIMAGALGSSYLEEMTLMDSMLIGILGLGMFAVGSFIAQGGGVIRHKDNTQPRTKYEMLGAMAWNDNYLSWMTIVDYESNNNWTFVLCSRSGRPQSTPIRTNKNFNRFRWTSAN